MSQSYLLKEKPIDTIQHYLEREFPGQVRDTQWHRQTGMQMFEVAHDTTVHHVEMPAGAGGSAVQTQTRAPVS